MRILSANSSYQRRKFGWESGVTDELRYLPTSSPGVCFAWFHWLACHTLGFSLSASLCCSESELRCVAPNPRIPRSEFVNSYQQQLVCCYVSFFFILSSSQDSMHCTLSLTVGLCTPCQKCKLHQRNRFFFIGVMTPTLWPVRPGVH